MRRLASSRSTTFSPRPRWCRDPCETRAPACRTQSVPRLAPPSSPARRCPTAPRAERGQRAQRAVPRRRGATFKIIQSPSPSHRPCWCAAFSVVSCVTVHQPRLRGVRVLLIEDVRDILDVFTILLRAKERRSPPLGWTRSRRARASTALRRDPHRSWSARYPWRRIDQADPRCGRPDRPDCRHYRLW
jgi:hypothetical protein